MFAWIVVKGDAFMGIISNVGIILRIMGEFEKSFWKE